MAVLPLLRSRSFRPKTPPKKFFFTRNTKMSKRIAVDSRIEGMNVDGKQCCVFAIPVKWSYEGEPVVWNMHGAWHKKNVKYGTDWFARATKDEQNNLILEHTNSNKDYGVITKGGIKWKKESWIKVHTVAPQFAYFRRPPYPMFSLFLIYSIAKFIAAIWGIVEKRLLKQKWKSKEKKYDSSHELEVVNTVGPIQTL